MVKAQNTKLYVQELREAHLFGDHKGDSPRLEEVRKDFLEDMTSELNLKDRQELLVGNTRVKGDGKCMDVQHKRELPDYQVPWKQLGFEVEDRRELIIYIQVTLVYWI